MIIRNMIHNMDCMQLLSQLPDESIDSIITDPPYMNTNFEYDNIARDELDLVAWFKEIIRVAKDNAPIVIFSSGKFTYKMVNMGEKYFRYELIWAKYNRPTDVLNSQIKPLRTHEIILIYTKTFHRDTIKYNHGGIIDKQSQTKGGYVSTSSDAKLAFTYKKLNDFMYPITILDVGKNSHNTPQLSHPSEKPFELIEKLVKMYSNEGDLVLDTFSGSGVVAHVCKYNNRDYLACEIDQEFYDMSLSRLNNDLLI